jgi:hypothetical protein
MSAARKRVAWLVVDDTAVLVGAMGSGDLTQAEAEEIAANDLAMWPESNAQAVRVEFPWPQPKRRTK